MESDISPYKDGYHRSLVSTYLLPVNTKITMIDFHKESKPVYYYYVVNDEDYNITYQISVELDELIAKYYSIEIKSPKRNARIMSLAKG